MLCTHKKESCFGRKEVFEAREGREQGRSKGGREEGGPVRQGMGEEGRERGETSCVF